MAGKTRDNRLRRFRHVEKRNNEDIIKEIGEIREEENREKIRPNKKRMGDIGEYMRACLINKNLISGRERWKERIQIVDLISAGWMRR